MKDDDWRFGTLNYQRPRPEQPSPFPSESTSFATVLVIGGLGATLVLCPLLAAVFRGSWLSMRIPISCTWVGIWLIALAIWMWDIEQRYRS